MGYNVAIDGPAGAGKSTIAKLVAKKKGYIYVDTGAMYRGLAIHFLDQGIQANETEKVILACQDAEVTIQYENEVQQVYLNGRNITSRLRDEEVGNMASVTSAIPQVRAMYAGDRARKNNLVEYGFRLPSAYDNRPLNFDEFYDHINQAIFVSATPSEFELERSTQVVEQVIRPTGLLDPEVKIRPIEGQVDDLYGEICDRVQRGERVLVTTLTKKMAEKLTEYFEEMGVRVRYLHSEVETIERMEIIRDLRLGVFDVLIGINLLREGLDIPEVSLVAILDADKEGFLRSDTSLIQTIGRAARNANGTVIMYADIITGSMQRAISETERRRKIQQAYNEEHGIVPQTIKKGVHEIIEATVKDDTRADTKPEAVDWAEDTELAQKTIAELTIEMKKAAELLQFELAAQIRDEINRLKEKSGE